MSARRSVLASLVAGIVFISAAPAWAVYTKFVNVEKSHTNGGDGLKIDGRLVLNDAKNPNPLPTDGKKCPKNRNVKVQKEKAGGGWKTLATVNTDDQGDFSATVDDKASGYRLKAPQATKGEALCYAAKKTFNHKH